MFRDLVLKGKILFRIQVECLESSMFFPEIVGRELRKEYGYCGSFQGLLSVCLPMRHLCFALQNWFSAQPYQLVSDKTGVQLSAIIIFPLALCISQIPSNIFQPSIFYNITSNKFACDELGRKLIQLTVKDFSSLNICFHLPARFLL